MSSALRADGSLHSRMVLGCQGAGKGETQAIALRQDHGAVQTTVQLSVSVCFPVQSGAVQSSDASAWLGPAPP